MGEVMINGNTIMKGYLKYAQAIAKAFEGGWIHTGDLRVINPDVYLVLKDRSKISRGIMLVALKCKILFILIKMYLNL